MDRLNFKILFLNIFLAIFLASCGGGGGGSTQTTTPPPDTNTAPATSITGIASCTVQNPDQGVICGKAVAADGVTPLSGAEIKVAATSATNMFIGTIISLGVSNPDKCLADILGDFACLLPANLTGNIDFVISHPGFAGKSFSSNVVVGQTTNAGTFTMTGDNTTNWAVVPGSYDGVQVLLAQLKGCTLNNLFGVPFNPTFDYPEDARASADCTAKGLVVLDENELATPESVSDVFTQENINTYDAVFINCDANWSFVEGVNAGLQAFSAAGKHIYFSDLSDIWLTSAFPGKINFAGNDTSIGTVPGNVTHTGLAAAVGNPIDIVFDLSVWTAIDTVTTDVTTFIEGDITPVSSYMGVHPITVGWRNNSTSGCVFYTSYHIEGASSGADQENAIKYLVQNIDQVCG